MDKQGDSKSTGASFVKGTDDTKPKAFDAQGSVGKHFTSRLYRPAGNQLVLTRSQPRGPLVAPQRRWGARFPKKA